MEFAADTVRLVWVPAADPNQTAALTYNVRIGTSPGAGDVLAPMARENGVRLLPAGGNAGTACFKLATHLAPHRTYYWSVQAVDNSFAGSTFAPEASFYLASPPTLTEIAGQTVREDESLGPVPFEISDPDSPPEDLRLKGASSDPAIVAPEKITFSGTGTHRSLFLTPQPDRHGTVEVTVTVENPTGQIAVRAFVLTIAPVNDPPVVQAQTLAVTEDQSVEFNLAAADPDGDSLQWHAVQAPWFGRIESLETGDGTLRLRYTPEPDFFGTDWLAYRVTDGVSESRVGQVEFKVEPVVDQPASSLTVVRAPTGDLWLVLVGEPRQRYLVELSRDLAAWSPYVTLEGAGEPVRFLDPLAGIEPMRFYRMRLWP